MRGAKESGNSYAQVERPPEGKVVENRLRLKSKQSRRYKPFAGGAPCGHTECVLSDACVKICLTSKSALSGEAAQVHQKVCHETWIIVVAEMLQPSFSTMRV